MSVLTKCGALALTAWALGAAPASTRDIPLLGAIGFVPQAQAVIGRPLTPVSYAGVARRTTRRAVYAGAAAGAAAQPTTVVVVAAPTSSSCVKFVDEQGQTMYRCP